MKFFLPIFIILLVIQNKMYSQPENTGMELHEYSILFVGNSLTYSNNLPRLVKKSARHEGIEIKTKMVAHPNYALEDHLNEGRVQRLINKDEYNFVIVQQGPSSQNNGRNMLIESGQKFSKLCAERGAELCYFMVWPSMSYYHTFEDVIMNYKDAAAINNAILIPVGQIWKTYIDSTENYHYYSADGFHPSVLGSEVAANTILKYLLKNNEGEKPMPPVKSD